MAVRAPLRADGPVTSQPRGGCSRRRVAQPANVNRCQEARSGGEPQPNIQPRPGQDRQRRRRGGSDGAPCPRRRLRSLSQATRFRRRPGAPVDGSTAHTGSPLRVPTVRTAQTRTLAAPRSWAFVSPRRTWSLPPDERSPRSADPPRPAARSVPAAPGLPPPSTTEAANSASAHHREEHKRCSNRHTLLSQSHTVNSFAKRDS